MICIFQKVPLYRNSSNNCDMLTVKDHFLVAKKLHWYSGQINFFSWLNIPVIHISIIPNFPLHHTFPLVAGWVGIFPCPARLHPEDWKKYIQTFLCSFHTFFRRTLSCVNCSEREETDKSIVQGCVQWCTVVYSSACQFLSKTSKHVGWEFLLCLLVHWSATKNFRMIAQLLHDLNLQLNLQWGLQ